MPIYVNSFSVGDGNFEVIQSGTDLVVVDAGTGGREKQSNILCTPKSYTQLANMLKPNATSNIFWGNSEFPSLLKNTQKVHINISHMHMDHMNLLPHVLKSIDEENNKRTLQQKPKIQLGEFVIGGEPSENFYQKANLLFDAITNQRDNITNNFQFSILCPNSKSHHKWKKGNGEWGYTDSNIHTFQIPLSGENKVTVHGRGMLTDNERGIKNTFTIYSPVQQRPGGQNANCNVGILKRGKCGVVFWGDATSEIQEESGLSDLDWVHSVTQAHHGSHYNIYPHQADVPLDIIISTGRDAGRLQAFTGYAQNRKRIKTYGTPAGNITRQLGSQRSRAIKTFPNRTIQAEDRRISLLSRTMLQRLKANLAAIIQNKK